MMKSNGRKIDPVALLKRIEYLMGVSRIGLDVIDSKYNIRYIDPAWKKVYGEPAGKKCFQYFMGRKSVCPGCGITKALKTRKITITQEKLVREGNRPIEVTTIPFKDEHGEWLVAETNVDISRIKRAEDALRESEGRYRMLFEKSNDAYMVADPRTRRFVDCNAKAEELTGYSRRQLLSMRVSQLHPKEEASGVMKTFRKMATEKSLFYETIIMRRDGSTRRVEISAVLLTIASKKCLLGVFRDVTERKKTDEALRQSEERYNALSESAQDAIFIVDRQYRYVYMNSYCAKTVGRKRSDAVGRHMKEIFQPGAAAVAMRNNKKVFMSGKPLFITEKLKLPVGERWLDSRLAPIKDAHGETIYVAGIARDITLIKKAEEVLKRDRDELDRLARKRSEELLVAQDQLMKSKRLSEIGLLAATIAHELRSPLAAIRTAAFNIQKKSGDPVLESHLANIDKKVLESDQIIKNLLHYSHIKAPQYEKIDPCLILEDCIALSKEVFRGYDVKVRKKFACRKKPFLEADPVQIREVFNNILNNAYESFPKKKGRIQIRAWLERGMFFKASFKDNGEGIDAEDLKRIAEPFFTTKTGGMGLGLTLCRQIVDLHNGKLEITSTKGKGAALTVILPLDRTVVRAGQ